LAPFHTDTTTEWGALSLRFSTQDLQQVLAPFEGLAVAKTSAHQVDQVLDRGFFLV
jgi:hypothetical protein